MPIRPELSIIMPVFNEAENLPRVIAMLCPYLSEWVKTYEILIVDDASKDNTPAIAQALSRTDDRIRLLQHPENRGPGSGIITGLANAKGRLVTFIPADLAITLNQFPKYLETAKEADLVIGIRSDRSDYSFLRKINSYVYIWMIKLLFLMKQRQFNYVHLYRRDIFNHIDVWSNGVFITAEIMIRGRDHGYRIKEVDIDYVPRTRGKASCGNPTVILKTFRDLILFWGARTLGRTEILKPRLNRGSNRL